MPLPAQNLSDANDRLSLEPLADQAGDYVDLSDARGSNCLRRVETQLRMHFKSSAPRCHLAFVGHRGSGKSTELFRLERELSGVCFPVHLTLDATLHEDADYPDLFLWLVEKVARKLHDAEVPFDNSHVEAVASWFAEVTKFEKEAVNQSVGIETEAEASLGGSWFGNGFKLLARLKSAFVGSKETRTEMRRQLKNRADVLLQAVNNFLNAASLALEAKRLPSRLLIVQDNLDRLSREAAMALFNDSAELIQQLNVACIWTAPVGTLLAPFHLGAKFDLFAMPMISVRRKNGTANPKAIKGFTALLAKRMEIGLTFANPKLVRTLILGSGGSVREMIKRVRDAVLNAVAESHTIIESDDVKRAMKNAAINLQNALTPNNIYFPILAQIYQSKEFDADLKDGYTTEAVNARRDFFHTLIAEGAVLAYNGEGAWYDVHPALLELASFKAAIEASRPRPVDTQIA